MNTSYKMLLGMLFPLCATVACDRGESADGDRASERAATTSSALFGGSKVLWPMSGGAATISVCWLPFEMGVNRFAREDLAPDIDAVVANAKSLIRSNVEQEWNGRTVVKFVGWQECADGDADVHLVPISSGAKAPEGDTYGRPVTPLRGSKGKGGKVYLNVLFAAETRYWVESGKDPEGGLKHLFTPAQCSGEVKALAAAPTEANLEAFERVAPDCLQFISTHEFGHVAGFAHEQFRADDPAAQQRCLDIAQQSAVVDPDADTPLGPFDAESLMSYCRTDRRPMLSLEDAAQTDAIYLKLAPKTTAPAPAPGEYSTAAGPVGGPGETPVAAPPAVSENESGSGGGCNARH